MIDIAIIGAGPAGLSAAINAKQRNKTVTVFGRSPKTSLLYAAENVDNYLGMENITGEELINTFYSHAINKGVEIKECRVQQIMPVGDRFMINLGNDIEEAKTVILALGISRGKSIEGEDNFVGKGVSYCATCDGMLYRNKTVVVVGDNAEAEEDAKFLSEICAKVFYIPKYEGSFEFSNNVEVIKSAAAKVTGEDTVKTLVLSDGSVIECDGIFFIKESVPLGSIVPGLKLEDGAIEVNRSMETNIKGVYAAGDCTGRPYQISKAVGEGLIAAQNAVRLV